MATRSSARTAASRNQASSPPRQPTQSPVARRTRTRSASVELGDNNATTTKRGKRSARQASVESVGSNASVTSSNQDGPRKKARGEITYPELSVVAEDAEDVKEEDEEEAGNNEGSGRLQQSPGGLSQMSGTTALTSASGQTSYTATEVAKLDPTMVMEVLPDLLESSKKLLALLAPVNASKELVEFIVRELKVPGSAQAKRLNHREEKFGLDREKFGRDDYIRPSFILQKLCGSQAELGMFRPDAILQAANLATLVKSLLVAPKEALSTYHLFSNLDTWFPESFVTQFDDNVDYGKSTMLDESFEMALEIRTQYTVVALLHHKAGEQAWDPDAVLTELFFDTLAKRSPRLSHFDDVMENGQVKNLMRAGPKNTEDQDAMVKERVLAIRNTFRQSEDAAQAGDLVDFDELEDRFPWSAFLAKIVQWTRSRLDEIEESVRLQGGVDNLIESLVETIKNNNSQAELDFETHPSTATPRQLLPAANIVPSTTGHSLMAKDTVRLLEMMKQDSKAPASNQGQRNASTSAAASSSNQTSKSSRPRPSKTRATGPLEPRQASHIFNPTPDDDHEEMVERTVGHTASDYVSTWEAYERDMQKENRKPRPRLIDEQANARKASPFSSSESEQTQENVAESSKRKHASVEPEDESESHDEGFQADRRNPDPNRRLAAPRTSTARPSSAVPTQRSPKRARVQNDEQADQEDEQAAQEEQQAAQAARRRQQRANSRQPAAEGDEEDPKAIATQAADQARVLTAIAKQRTAETQSRTPWSEADTDHLIDLIGIWGCSWSDIEKAGRFEVERGQVALKDKARNLKVLFLKAGTVLPVNFDKIALGKKEIRSVQSVRPDYEP